LASDPWFVRTMLAPPYVSHRSAWLAPGSSKVFDWGDVLSRAEVTFLDGRYHSTSVHGPILSATLGTLGVELIRRRGRRAAQLLGVIALTYLLALADPLGSWQGMRPVWDAFPFLRTVHVRFHWFLPTIWFVTLAWIVTIWCREWRSFRVTAPLVTAFLLFVAGNVFVSKTQASNDTIQSYEAMFAQWRGKRTRDLSYSEFVAHDLFDSIDRYIGRPKESYRVASIGIHPAVAALNGFQTIDGYHDNYPLAYKQRLRRLIRFELAKDRRQRHMFEDWGSRAYVLFAKQDMSQLSRRQRNKPIETRDITLDPYAATDLHLSYVFSAYPLSFPLRSGLVFAREFHDSVAAWRVFLYRQLPMLGAL
jgi:hypothetical protein